MHSPVIRDSTSTAAWLLVLFWTLEVFVTQAIVLAAPFTDPSWLVLRWVFRLVLDLSLIALVVTSLPRPAIAAIAIGQFAVMSLGSVYWDIYGRLPRVALLFAQAGEGAVFLPQLGQLLPAGRTALFAVGLAAKLALLWLIPKRVASRLALPGWFRRLVPPWPVARLRLYSGVTYLACLVWGFLGLDPLKDMKTWGTTDRYGVTYGFSIPMLAEAYFARSSSYRERALEAAEKPTDRLTPIEAAFPVFDRIVFLQVESLDFGVIDYRNHGVEVMPVLNRLKRSSMFFKAEAIHINGSADADFVAMMGVMPSPDIVTYKIGDYPFDAALPRALNRLGFSTSALHGVASHFYDRDQGFSKMGFQHLLFKDELKAKNVPTRSARHDWIHDGDLLAFGAEELRRENGKAFHFLITVTSHAPFDELPDEEPCNQDELADRYFCSMSYVDRALARYIDALPAKTTLLIYGDHNSSVRRSDYASGRVGDRDFVPVFIHNTPGDLAAAQKTRDDPIATNGQLTFVDIARYMHRQILRSHAAKAEESDRPMAAQRTR